MTHTTTLFGMKMKLRKVSEYQSHILWLDKGYGFRVTIRGEMLSEPLTAEDVARDFPIFKAVDARTSILMGKKSEVKKDVT